MGTRACLGQCINSHPICLCPHILPSHPPVFSPTPEPEPSCPAEAPSASTSPSSRSHPRGSEPSGVARSFLSQDLWHSGAVLFTGSTARTMASFMHLSPGHMESPREWGSAVIRALRGALSEPSPWVAPGELQSSEDLPASSVKSTPLVLTAS